MFTTTIAQTTPSVQSTNTTVVYEYVLTLFNPSDDDRQELTAAFTSIPSFQDWQQWLTGWNSCGYSLVSTPQLKRTI